MAEISGSRLWLARTAYLGLALTIMFFHLLPLDTVPRRWAPPDLLIAFTFAWALRRPDYVPAVSVAAVMLLADLLFQRPPGLLALLVVLGSEYLKTRSPGLRDAGFVGEWAVICMVLAVTTLANRLILGLLAVQQAQLTLSLTQLILTAAAYPLVVLVTQSVLGVRKPTRSPAEPRGART